MGIRFSRHGLLVLYSISIMDNKLENITSESIKVEAGKQSLFLQIHVVAETIMTLRIPLLYEVGFLTLLNE